MPVLLLGSPNRRDELMNQIWSKIRPFVTPNEPEHLTSMTILSGGYVVGVIGLIWWMAVSAPAVFPTPLDAISKIPSLWVQDGLGQELITSIMVSLEALFWSVLIALPLGYMSKVAVVRPLALGISKLRFLSPAVFFTILLYATSSGHQIKVSMLVVGEVVFLLTSVIGIVSDVSQDLYDDASTLRMGPWQSMWYVTIRGTIPAVLHAIRDNAAMGWSMLMMVEGMVRSEGGVGLLIVNKEKHLDFAESYIIMSAILIVGIFSDYLMGVIERAMCPYEVTNE